MPALHHKRPVKGQGDATMKLCDICSYGIRTEASTARTIDAQQSDERIVGQLCDECASKDASRQRALGGLRIRATLVVE